MLPDPGNLPVSGIFLWHQPTFRKLLWHLLYSVPSAVWWGGYFGPIGSMARRAIGSYAGQQMDLMCFYDPTSSESYDPRFAKGRVDFRAQRLGITATGKQWFGSAMIERMFLWTWDARPYLFYPDLVMAMCLLKVIVSDRPFESLQMAYFFDAMQSSNSEPPHRVSPYEYMLSGLLRGRLGTEAFHMPDACLAKMTMPQGIIGQSYAYKPVSIGQTLGQTTAGDFTYRGNSLKPYSPVAITGMRDGSGKSDHHMDIPLSEASEAYEVEVMDGSTVTAAEQVSDFGSLQKAVSVRIYQISAIVGRGNAGVSVL